MKLERNALKYTLLDNEQLYIMDTYYVQFMHKYNKTNWNIKENKKNEKFTISKLILYYEIYKFMRMLAK